jgi:hypothetical protein
MLLQDTNAVIYGGGGAIGGAVARAFARVLEQPAPPKLLEHARPHPLLEAPVRRRGGADPGRRKRRSTASPSSA